MCAITVVLLSIDVTAVDSFHLMLNFACLEPKIHDLDMVSGGKLLENKEARQKISVKPKKTRPGSRHPRTRTTSPVGSQLPVSV